MRVLALVLVVVSAVGAAAQSLGDVARKEAERRKAVKAPAKTYTNDQLKSEPRDVPSTPATPLADTATPPAVADTPGASAKSGDAGAQKDQAEAAKDAPKNEAYWKARVQAEREALSRAQIFADALQSRINGLSTDFAARDDPAQRAAVSGERQKSLDELQRVKKEIDQHTKALAEIQEEARRTGVPAGWLR